MARMGLGFCGQPYSLKEIMASAILAEKFGYESVWITEDIWTGRDALSILACVAQKTEKIKLGTAVINIYTRHPILTAQTFNSLSEIAPGRLILGIGAGMTWRKFLEAQGRVLHPISDMRQAVYIIRDLLARKSVEIADEHISLDVSRKCFYDPFLPTKNYVPIYMGAVAPRMTELAGEIGDGLMLELAVRKEDIPIRLNQLKKGTDKCGRNLDNFDVCELIITSVSKDGSIHPNALGYAVKTVALLSKEMIERCDFDPELVERIRQAHFCGDCELAYRLITPQMVSSFIAAGDQDQCLEFIEGIVNAGVKLPILLPFGGDINDVIAIGVEYIKRNS